MSPELNDVLAALPDEFRDDAGTTPLPTPDLLAHLATRPVPTGRAHRFWAMSSIHARIAAAYLAWWIRAGFKDTATKDRMLDETHLRIALRLLGSMSHLRGAYMKVGQAMATWPDLAPDRFAEILGRLQFEAPPMHYSLVREQLQRELGADPHDIFDHFEETAFAAASLGQVHRATFRGRPVAVKVQYPNIARTIRSDFRNLITAATPMRLTANWDNTILQIEDIVATLEMEVDYIAEAEHMRHARAFFNDDDNIVIPEPIAEVSTARILTMDFLEGDHLDAFMRTQPSPEARTHYAERFLTAMCRLSYKGHLLHADPHIGNIIFMPDGRLGVLDFGCCRRYSDEEVVYLDAVEDVAFGQSERMREILAVATDTPEDKITDDMFQRMSDWCEWVWEPMIHDGPFDFSDPTYCRRGMEIFRGLIKQRYNRAKPVNTWLNRHFVGVRAILHRLEASVDMNAICQRESTVERGAN